MAALDMQQQPSGLFGSQQVAYPERVCRTPNSGGGLPTVILHQASTEELVVPQQRSEVCHCRRSRSTSPRIKVTLGRREVSPGATPEVRNALGTRKLSPVRFPKGHDGRTVMSSSSEEDDVDGTEDEEDEDNEPGSILERALDLTGAVAEKLAEAFKPLCIERQESREELDHQESTVYLRPSPEVSIPLDFDLYTCQDDFDLSRHFVMKPQGYALMLELSAYDELLVLDQECLVDLSHEEVLSRLAHIKLNKPFNLVIRRSLSTTDDKKKYQYIKFTAKLQAESEDDNIDGQGGSTMVLKVDVSLTRSAIIPLDVRNVKRCNIFCAGAGSTEYYLCYNNNQLRVENGFKPGLMNAVFEMLICRMFFNGRMASEWGTLVRYRPKSSSKSQYLQVYKNCKLGFKGMQGKNAPTTADTSLVFRTKKIKKSIFALECVSLKGHFLCRQGSKLVVEEVDSIHDKDNAHFITHDAKYSDNSIPFS